MTHYDPTPDLSESRRLLKSGMHLVRLHPNQKRPVGDAWNAPENRVAVIEDDATGYGLPLAANNLCSIDPDNWQLAVTGMRAIGFDLDEIMAAGARTSSTRPESGGRSAFAEVPGLSWLSFRSNETGTVIEFRACSPNLQDCVPGVVYKDKSGTLRTQTYANEKRLDAAPALPDRLKVWWHRCSTDIAFLNQQEGLIFAALNVNPILSISTGINGGALAYPAPGFRSPYNDAHPVEDILSRHGYSGPDKRGRWAPPTATGAPAVRSIRGKAGLWQSDHASDPLKGTFDAWTAHVVLDHHGDVAAAIGEATARIFTSEIACSDSYASVGVNQHPLAKFVDFDGTAKPPRWVIPGFIGHGVVVISGAPGVGKTTTVLPLALTATGLHGGDLMPRQWRHVVYITEDIEQVKRILAGIVGYGRLGIAQDLVRERLHMVEAVRLDPTFVATVGKTYHGQFTRTVGDVAVLPWVVFDTKSAVLKVENENDNAEASDMMAALKQGFAGLPVLLVGHLAKPNLSRLDVEGLTSRGASAIEGDANQTMFLIREGERRYLMLGKTRFEPKWRELEITSHTATTLAIDEFGEPERITMRWGIAAPPLQSRKQATEQAAERAKQLEGTTLRQKILDAVEHGWQLGNPLNRAGVKAQVSRNGAVVGLEIEKLLSEGLLHEVPVPAAIRTNPKRAAFLVSMTAEEHSANAGLPAAKQVIPTSWRKPPNPSVPGALPNA